MQSQHQIQLTDYQGSLFRRFTGKEKDSESGYYYFGARYFMPNLSIWNSVDPMADKYPSLSPYNYCAWNPMRIIDPMGDTLVLSGEAYLVKYIISDLQKRTDNLSLSVDDNGIVHCTGEALTDDEMYMEKIIKNDKIKVDLLLQSDRKINENMEILNGGSDAFLGNTLRNTIDGPKANARQIVDVLTLRKIDPNSGNLIWHAAAEGYEGGLIAINTNKSYNNPQTSDFWSCYSMAHNNANFRFCGNINGFGLDKDHILYYLEK